MRQPREVRIDDQLYTIRAYCELRGISDYATIRSIARSVHTFCETNPSKKAQGRELQRLVKYRLLTKISPPPGIKPRPWAGSQYTINDKQYSVRSYCESQGLTDLGQICQLRDHINSLRAYRKNIPDYMFEDYLVYRVGEALGHSLCVCPTWNGQKLSTREFRLQPPAAPIQPPKASSKVKPPPKVSPETTPPKVNLETPSPVASPAAPIPQPTHADVNDLIQVCAAMLTEINTRKTESHETLQKFKVALEHSHSELEELDQQQSALTRLRQQALSRISRVEEELAKKREQNDKAITALNQLIDEKRKQIQELLQA